MPAIITYYLEMKSPQMLKEKAKPEDFDVIEAEVKQYQLNRFLYQYVGESWQWHDKNSLTDEAWKDYAENDNLRTWVAYYRGSIAGYFELQRQADTNVEIIYFGLAPGFIGKGFGGYLLSCAIKSAWTWADTKRVWVHTCSLDHASALNNYLARGFEIYDQTVTNI